MMNVVSPPLRSRPPVSMVTSGFNDQLPLHNEQPIEEHIDEIALFCLLEKQRNAELWGVYHGATPKKHDHQSSSNKGDIALPKVPPRYQCIHFSAEWFVSQINKQSSLELPTHSGAKEQWDDLDHDTQKWIGDMVKVLRGRCSGSNSIQTRRWTCVSFAPTTITPPASPLTLQYAASEDTQGYSTEARKKEVDLSDDEIMSLWNCASPSGDGVDFGMCL